jgi:ATP adenylyltransferase
VERLWSPWRMEYLEAHQDRSAPEGCVFCSLWKDGDPDGERILHRGTLAFVSLAKYPYNPGHLLVLPVRHTGDLETLTVDEGTEVHALLQLSVRALTAASAPHGFNVGLNLGRVAGAGIPDHLHWHVVPRWGGDTNFMPVIGQTRVLPQMLSETYERLAPYFSS